MENNYSVNISWSGEDRGFIATMPEFPGLSAYGKTYVDVAENAQIAIQAALDVLAEDGFAPPVPIPPQHHDSPLGDMKEAAFTNSPSKWHKAQRMNQGDYKNVPVAA